MKFKKFISLLASLAMMVTAVTGAMTVSASEVANGTCGDGITWTLDSDGKLTISGKGEMATPYEGVYNNLDLVNNLTDNPDIYTYKKEHKDDIKEVVIEEGVTSVGFCAFYKMPNLETVVLPKTITKFSSVCVSTGTPFKSYSFAECPKLKNLTLTEGMTALGGLAFYKCTALESVRIPSTLIMEGDFTSQTNWGESVFSNCTSLKNVTLPEGLVGIGALAFENTAIESIVIPSTIQQWNGRASGSNSSTTNYAFKDCSKLSTVTLKEGITKIWGSPFIGCPMLKRILVPASVTDITLGFGGSNNYYPEFEIAFEDGSQLTEIGEKTFIFVKLKALEIPEGVTNVLYSNAGDSAETIYIYSETVDISLLPKSSIVYSYYGSQASTQATFHDIEEEMSKTYDELSTAVEEAEKYSEEKYTEESYGVLKELLEQASTKSEKSHILGMKYLTEDIYSAIEGLEEKKDEPPSSDPSDSSSNPSDSSNPSGSDQSQPSNSGSSQPTSAQPVTNAPTTASPKVTPPAVTTVAKPAKVKAVKVKAKKKKLNVSWKKVSGATGYEVMSATNNKFTKGKKTVTVKKNKVTLKKLKPKKKYFVKVRAYKLANGRKYFGKWSKVVKKKTK